MIHRLEALWWLLFGAGGFAAAMVLPALFFALAVAFPLGWFGDAPTTFFRMKALFANPVGQLVLFGVISLTFWHSAHHLRHFAIDMGFGHQANAIGTLLYLLALVGTGVTALVVAGL